MQYIGLLDCNNFFVSCERLFRPDLVGRPVVVLSGNDGCVVARSNEIKALGVPMGIPYFQVKKELADAGAAIFSSNFTLYRDISRRVMHHIKLQVPTIEVYSIDEAFFTIEANSAAEAKAEALRIKQTVEQTVGLPVSVGVARTKTIAKYASSVAKEAAKRGVGPGVACVEATDWQQRVGQIELQQIWGVGAKLAARLRSHEVLTVADFLAIDPARLQRLFGVWGVRMQAELNEQPIWRVGEQVEAGQKSYMSSRSFAKSTSDLRTVTEAVVYHTAHVAADMRADGVACRSLTVMALPSRHSDWILRPNRAEVTFDAPINDTGLLQSEARRLLAQFFDRQVPYKKAGVVVWLIVPTAMVQGDLFAADEELSRRRTAELMDSINTRFGRDTVTVGRLPGQGAWQPRTDWLSPQYTTRWSDIASVQA